MAIAAAVNWAANAAIGFSYPLLDEVIGGKTFFIFAALLLIFVIYTFLKVPETKNKSISEIQNHFLTKLPSDSDFHENDTFTEDL